MSLKRLFFFLILLVSLSAQADLNLGENLARQGVSSGKGGLSTLDAEKEMGVSASGGVGSGGRSVNVEYSQVLTGQLECPLVAGETGRYSNLQQFVSACENEVGARKLWVCVPFDQNDSMTSDCTDGSWKSISISRNDNSWKSLGGGLETKISGCDEDDCEYKVKISNDFQGGEGEATNKGESQLASSKGPAELIQKQGSYLPDGTVLQPGSNPNSGEILGEMLAASSVAACADDVKASILSGTVVFTCDGKEEVDTITGGEESCEEIETCVETSTENQKVTKTCDVSLEYNKAECISKTPAKSCEISSVYEERHCNKTTSARLITKQIYTTGFGKKCKNFAGGYGEIQGGLPAMTRMHTKIKKIVGSVGGYPVTFDGKKINRRSDIEKHGFCGGVMVGVTGGHYFCEAVKICKSTPANCDSGFKKDGRKCTERVNTNGYKYIGKRNSSWPGRSGVHYKYYKKEVVNNGCSNI